ncbi:MAG TPA: hypothetical protein VGF28_27255 [Thermoanaerobaculia bacterium]|jgi:hypothetical protein
MRSTLLLAIGVAAAVVASAPRASAQPTQPFDVVAVGLDCLIILPIYGPSLQFLGISIETDTDVQFLAPAGEGRVLALARGGSRIEEVRPDLTRTPVFSGIPGTEGRSFVVDAAGNIYLATESGRLLAIRPDGTVRADYGLNVLSMDLAADQCTLFYLTSGGIERFNVCTGTPLPDFPANPPFGNFKLLPDGGLLLRGDSGKQVVRYNAAGIVVRTYPLVDEAGGILVLGRAGRTMITGEWCGNGTFHEYDLETGAILRTLSFEFQSVESLVTYNGFTAALGTTAAAHVAAVPSLSTSMLAVLGTLLMLIAIRRLV